MQRRAIGSIVSLGIVLTLMLCSCSSRRGTAAAPDTMSAAAATDATGALTGTLQMTMGPSGQQMWVLATSTGQYMASVDISAVAEQARESQGRRVAVSGLERVGPGGDLTIVADRITPLTE
jgi:hypothetical protein